MISQKAKIQEAVAFIRNKTSLDYPVGIVLGTGLGALVKEIDIDFSLDYSDIPNFPVIKTTVRGRYERILSKVLLCFDLEDDIIFISFYILC